MSSGVLHDSIQDLKKRLLEKDSELKTLHDEGVLITGKAAILEAQVEYLKGQVELYQVRMGLVTPAPAQGVPLTEHKPIRKSREPFESLSARIGKAQADKTEEYWRARAAAVDVAGVTSDADATVKEENDTDSH